MPLQQVPFESKNYDFFTFFDNDVLPAREPVWIFPAREIGYPCPNPVQLSPEKIEQEKQQAEKKIFRNKHTKKILGSLEKIEIRYEYTFYVFSDGSRWRLDYYHEHIESIPLCGPYLSDYGIHRKDKQGFTPVRTYQATNDMFE